MAISIGKASASTGGVGAFRCARPSGVPPLARRQLEAKYTVNLPVVPVRVATDHIQRQLGEVVQLRALSDYEEVAR